MAEAILEKLKNNGTIQLETERFILRKFRISDAHDVYENWSSDKDSAKYNAWKVHSDIEVTKEYLADWIEGYKKDFYYHWAIEDKENEEIIGSISATNVKKRKKYCEIGYTIAKKMWNRGIATEVLICVIKYLTDEGFQIIRAIHDVRNIASGKVMEKAGMEFVKTKYQIYLSSADIIMKCNIYEVRGTHPHGG